VIVSADDIGLGNLSDGGALAAASDSTIYESIVAPVADALCRQGGTWCALVHF
jgi:hypothetical protein